MSTFGPSSMKFARMTDRKPPDDVMACLRKYNIQAQAWLVQYPGQSYWAPYVRWTLTPHGDKSRRVYCDDFASIRVFLSGVLLGIAIGTQDPQPTRETQ